jgi:hypothetical protein
MLIKEVIPTNEDFSGQFVTNADPIVSEEDTARILAVKESDFSEPMTGDELMQKVYAALGMK